MLERIEHGDVVFYRSPRLHAHGFPHGFSTRLGGVSPPPFDSLNFGNWSASPVQDSDDNLQENYRRFQAALGVDGRRRRWSYLVHGADVVVIGPDTQTGGGCKADGLVTADPRRVVGAPRGGWVGGRLGGLRP